MARFKSGDRVQLTGDIARFYGCVIGVVHHSGADQTSVLVQYRVRLADGTIATFYDFQLQVPPVVRAHVVFDSSTAKSQSGTRGQFEARHVLIVGAGVEIHVKISKERPASIIGQVTVGKSGVAGVLVTLGAEDGTLTTRVTENGGEFEFRGVPAGEVMLEGFVPGKRIVGLLNIADAET